MKIGYLRPDKLIDVIKILQSIDDKIGAQNDNTKVSEKRLLDLNEASVFIGLPKGTVYNMSSRKQIPVIRVNRKLLFDKQKLEKWISENSVEVWEGSRRRKL